MKPYRILTTFKGTQTGHGDGELFTAGTTATLSDHLAEVVLKAGMVKPVGEAETRETKVTAPEETKVVEPEETKAEDTPKRKKKA